MKFSLVLIVLTFAVSIAIGIFIPDDSGDAEYQSVQTKVVESASPTSVNSNISDIAELNRLLQQEIEARKSLELKLDALSVQVAEFKREMQNKSANSTEQTSREGSPAAETDSDWFNEQALVDNGLSNSQARELKHFFEQQELQQLYLRDQANREGWDRQKFRDEIQALNDKEDALEDSLGETAFDAYLYASGQSNRVAVSSVLATAPAGAAGIQSGDHILRYDNQRIYSGFELRQATLGGNEGDSIPIEVERDGEILEFYVVRGPLGIRMNSVSVAP